MYNWHRTWNGRAALVDQLRADAKRAAERGELKRAVELQTKANLIADAIGYQE